MRVNNDLLLWLPGKLPSVTHLSPVHFSYVTASTSQQLGGRTDQYLSKIEPIFMGADVGNIRHPYLVRLGNAKLLCNMIGHDG